MSVCVICGRGKNLIFVRPSDFKEGFYVHGGCAEKTTKRRGRKRYGGE